MIAVAYLLEWFKNANRRPPGTRAATQPAIASE